MKRIPDDYEIPEQREYANFENGDYTVDGMNYFSVDEHGKPMLVEQAGKMVARVRFTMGEEEGPPYSGTLGDMALLAVAFGADREQLPLIPTLDKAGAVSAYLTQVAELVNASGKQVVVRVAGNWVNSVEGAQVPPGMYYFRLVDIAPKDADGQPEWREGQFGRYYLLEFEILAGEGGADTPWRGARFTNFYSYALLVGDDMQPIWERKQSGGEYTTAAWGMNRLIAFTAPATFDVVKEDPSNILPEWLREALKTPAVVKGYRTKYRKKSNGKIAYKLDIPSLEPVTDFKVSRASEEKAADPGEVEVSQGEAKERDEEALQQQGLQIFRRLMDALAGEDAFRGDTFNLTPAGRTTAKAHLTPLKQQGVLTTSSIKALTFNEMLAVMTALKQDEKLGELVGPYNAEMGELWMAAEEDDDF